MKTLYLKLLLLVFCCSKTVTAQDCTNQLFDQQSNTIITQTNSGFLNEFQEESGIIDVINIGDLNLDGYDDVVIGACTHGGTGAINVCFLDENSNILQYQTINNNHGELQFHLNEGSNFGLESIYYDDYNNDGIQDIVVSSYRDNANGYGTGAFYILCLDTNGTVKEDFKIGYGQENIPFEICSANRFFGSSLSNIGDINGDGITDLAIGVLNYDNDQTNIYAGAVAILLMDVDGLVKQTTIISEDHPNFDYSLDGASRLGGSTQLLGDLNQDGLVEIMVSSLNGSHACNSCGSNFILSIDSTGYLINTDRFYGIDSLLNYGDEAAYISSVPDLNENGIMEVIISANKSDNHTEDGGDLFLAYLNSSGQADSVVKLITSFVPQEKARLRKFVYDVNGHAMVSGSGILSNNVKTGGIIKFKMDCVEEEPEIECTFLDADPYKFHSLSNDFFDAELGAESSMTFVKPIGDLNNDGSEDIAIGSFNYKQTGGVFICFLNENNDIIDYQIIDNDNGNLGYALNEGNAFGNDGDTIGDYNGDGIMDMVVGAFMDSNEGLPATGAIYILCLNNNGTVKESFKIGYGTPNISDRVLGENKLFGSAIENIGDVNKDGIVDLMVGSVNYNSSNTETYVGAITQILLGSNGSVLSSNIIAEDTQNFGFSLNYGDKFGAEISLLGDLNNDGVMEYAVNAHSADESCIDCGSNYVLSITNEGNVEQINRIDALDSILVNGDKANAFNLVADRNGNGLKELVIGTYRSDDVVMDGGQLYLLYLNENGQADSVISLLDQVSINENSSVFCLIEEVNEDMLIAGLRMTMNDDSVAHVFAFEKCTSILDDIDNFDPIYTDNQIALYPNPIVSGEDVIVNHFNLNSTSLTVYNSLGQQVPYQIIEKSDKEVKLNFNDVSKTLLFIEFTMNDNSKMIKKLVVQ